MKKYWIVWKKLAENAFQEAFLNRFTNVLFIFGKCLRFTLFLVLLFSIKTQLKTVAGYSTEYLVVFFLVFNWFDITAQILFRGVYLFRDKVRRGEFDFDLLRPINPLFRSLFGKPDINDVIFLIPITIVSVWLGSAIVPPVSLTQVLILLVLLVNAFLISATFHILVLCLGVITTEVDNAVMLLRDTSNFTRFPVDIYQPFIRFILFTIVPFGLMVTIPSQVLLGLPLSVNLALTCVIGITFFVSSLLLWKYALKQYSSASS